MTRADAVPALRVAARVGDFFAVDIDPDDPWIPLRELSTDEAALDDRVARTRRSVAGSSGVDFEAVPLRTAASIDQLALAARVLSPALGACALGGVVPAFTPDNVGHVHGSQQLCVTQPHGSAATTAQHAADALYDDVIDSVIAPLSSVYATRFHVSTKVLWGNIASALQGAVEVLDASALAQAVPARGVVHLLLGMRALRGTARSPAPRFVRNSCCLWYRIPGSTICGDCVLSA